MSSNKETFGKTVGFVLAVCVVCALLVSFSAVQLKPLQKANKALDQQTKILEASGLLAETDGSSKSIKALYNEKVFGLIVELDSGNIECSVKENNAEDGCYTQILNFDERRNARDTALSSKPEDDLAGINRRSNTAVVYLVKNETGAISTVVFPIIGSGLWDLMYGYVGLEADLNTVKSVIYSDHKETPGLGAEVLNPKWKALWPGKKIYNDADVVKIKLVKGGAKPGNVHGVDALSGATLTSNGVTNTLQFWFGEEGYKTFITKYLAEGVN